MRAHMVIEGRMAGLNEYVDAERRNRYAGAKLKKAETERAAAAARAYGMPRFDGPVEVSFVWYERNRRRDVDNVCAAKKFVLDGLVRAGVLPDDSQRHVRALRDMVLVDAARPRVEVFVDGEALG